MFIFLPKTENRDEFFITDSIFLYFFYNIIKRIKARKGMK